VYEDILLIVLYLHKSWFLAARGKTYDLKVFENEMLKEIFGRQRGEITGE
jgi:hypothetical protein